MTTEAIALSDEEQHDLAGCEAVIERGLKTFREVGAALTEIRDARLYRGGYDTFEDYLSARWAMQRAQAYRLIEASAVVGALSPIGDTPLPATESQARELARVPEEQRGEVWAAAVERNGGQPAPARLVAEVAAEAVKPATHACQACGAGYQRWYGKCPGCEAWNTIMAVPEDDGGLMAHAMPELLDEPAGDRLEDGTPIVRRNDLSALGSLMGRPAAAPALTEREILAKAKEIRQASRVAQRDERTAMHREVSKANQALDFAGRRFAVVEADPPWKFGQEGVNGAAGNHYPLMTTAEICEMPIAPLCLPSAILFLWVPNALLVDGLAVLHAWGFDYKTSASWDKGDDNHGTGFYNFQDHETLLIGVRGGGMTPVVRFSSVIRAPKGEHSAKPDLAYEQIEAMFPDAPRLGLFRRSERDGWTPWGNQVLEAEVVA
jgi:N6-adenosine-specific RNA methylase IME4